MFGSIMSFSFAGFLQLASMRQRKIVFNVSSNKLNSDFHTFGSITIQALTMFCQLEICANSVTSALAAQEGGADRVELCQNLNIGGTTPSHGQIRLAMQLLHIGVHVLIRPRGGDFLYSTVEFEEMKADIAYCKEMGCTGVVFGLLKQDGRVDAERTGELVSLASPMQITFHRAFDVCHDAMEALETIIRCGCVRLLTSGMERTALEGVERIGQLVAQAGERIQIMPGSGIDAENVLTIADITGARAFHASAKEPVRGNFKKPGEELGIDTQVWVSSKEKIRRLADRLKAMNTPGC